MLEFHRKMLGDSLRNDAFHAALKRVIVPGESVVADIGSGTGFLSFLASRLGAKACHLYEHGGIAGICRTLASLNNITNCSVYHRHSAQVKKPVQADIIVSETLGNFALEEHIIENMNDARKRFLKEGGTLIPSRLSQFICPVIRDRLTKEIDTWGAVGFDLDLSPARDMGFNNIYVRTIEKNDLLNGGDAVQKFDAIDFSKENDSRRSWSLQWKIQKDTPVFGFALWWEVELLPGITLSTSPFEKPTHWEQIFVPLMDALPAKEGDALSLSLTSDSRYEVGLNVTWEAALFREGKKVASSPRFDMRRGRVD